MGGTEGTAEGTPSWPLAAGTCLGKYQIVRFLGDGGMGAVYEGLHIEMGKRVAIKTINPALAAIPEVRARFLLEAQLTSRVRHPHTVDVTDICMEGEQAFLVMEYLEGEDLAKHLRHHGPLPVEQVVDIALPILAAVAAAHEEGIVHRDLKPQNIFLAQMRDGTIHPKVLDFGISKAPQSPIRTSGVILGSPSYFAPEQVEDPKAISAASDQYALGVILYECVTGRLPYEGSNLAAIFQAIVAGTHQPPRVFRPDLPELFQNIIARAMSLAPHDRFPSVKDVGRALIALASPKTRLLWEDHFGVASPGAPPQTLPSPSPVPVTDQTPGSSRPARSVTASLPANHLSPRPERSEPSLVVPRRFHAARWAIGGALVAAACLATLFAFRGRPRRTLPVAVPSPATATKAKAPATAAPAPAPARHEEAGGERAEEATRPAAADEPKPEAESNVKKARSGRAAHRPRFGSNRSPLIE